METMLSVQRLHDPRADYIKISGTIDKAFSPERVGAINRPTVIDLGEVQSITSQGVQRWGELLRSVSGTSPLYLVNVPPPFAAQIEFVPNFTGHAELISARATSKCTGCDHEQQTTFDLMSYTSGSALLERCSKCGAVMVASDVDLAGLAAKRARTIAPEIESLLAKLRVYRRSAPTQHPFEIGKLVEGDSNLLRLSGTFDEKFRWQRLLDGLEGTLLLEASQLDVPEGSFRRFGELIAHAGRVCSPVVLVDMPSNALRGIVRQIDNIPSLIVHSVVAPCYCASCDEIRPLALGRDELLAVEPQATCPRCGRVAPLIAGMLNVERVRPLLRPTPEKLATIIGRFDELFSAAEVEAKLTTPPVAGGTPSTSAPQRIGPYRIIKSIARGGMADVFLATRDDFSKPMALKLLRREVLAQARISLSMFLREARINALLNHPNIVQVFDVNESEGNLYIVMEYLQGHALWRILSHHGGPFPVRIALRIMGQVLRALQCAHTAKDPDGKPLSIVHRDVSPSNIIVCSDGNVKLIDFGIALAGSTPDVVAGNPAWMSPEQYSGGQLDGRSDLFSAATVLHELLNGKQLFEGARLQEIGLAVLQAPIPTPPGIPIALARVLERAQQRVANARFQSAGEFADALRAVAEEHGGEASEHEVQAFVAQVMASPPKSGAVARQPSNPPDPHAQTGLSNPRPGVVSLPPVSDPSLPPQKRARAPGATSGQMQVMPTPTPQLPIGESPPELPAGPPPGTLAYTLLFVVIFTLAFGAFAFFTFLR